MAHLSAVAAAWAAASGGGVRRRRRQAAVRAGPPSPAAGGVCPAGRDGLAGAVLAADDRPHLPGGLGWGPLPPVRAEEAEAAAPPRPSALGWPQLPPPSLPPPSPLHRWNEATTAQAGRPWRHELPSLPPPPPLLSESPRIQATTFLRALLQPPPPPPPPPPAAASAFTRVAPRPYRRPWVDSEIPRDGPRAAGAPAADAPEPGIPRSESAGPGREEAAAREAAAPATGLDRLLVAASDLGRRPGPPGPPPGCPTRSGSDAAMPVAARPPSAGGTSVLSWLQALIGDEGGRAPADSDCPSESGAATAAGISGRDSWFAGPGIMLPELRVCGAEGPGAGPTRP